MMADCLSNINVFLPLTSVPLWEKRRFPWGMTTNKADKEELDVLLPSALFSSFVIPAGNLRL
jgi:hypothetical protein